MWILESNTNTNSEQEYIKQSLFKVFSIGDVRKSPGIFSLPLAPKWGCCLQLYSLCDTQGYPAEEVPGG